MDQEDASIKRLSGILPLMDEYSNEENEKALKQQDRDKSGSNS